MEKDKDDHHRKWRASHSRRVMEAVGQIAKPRRAANINRRREIRALYTNEYLRKPTPRDMRRLLMKGEMSSENILTQSPVFDELLQGKSPKCTYWVNGNKYEGPYYLADGIYPRWSTAVDRMFDVEALRSIMMTYIILHNMIVEDEYDYDVIDEYEPDPMNNSRTQIYCAHDRTEDPVQHEPLEHDGRYNELTVQRYTSLQEQYWQVTHQNDLIKH
ncbi:uncharacterized protein [Malus domestica]|uniref:uncharacterized protein n=1 Tax=Malus domestica TaxID=3750 RepID=UPI00397477F9